MNTPFLETQNRNISRPFRWVVRDTRGNYTPVSGWFASREAAEVWRAKLENESATIFCS